MSYFVMRLYSGQLLSATRNALITFGGKRAVGFTISQCRLTSRSFESFSRSQRQVGVAVGTVQGHQPTSH
jgi:hypothetical protein